MIAPGITDYQWGRVRDQDSADSPGPIGYEGVIPEDGNAVSIREGINDSIEFRIGEICYVEYLDLVSVVLDHVRVIADDVECVG